jgi:hypothetical protein
VYLIDFGIAVGRLTERETYRMLTHAKSWNFASLASLQNEGRLVGRPMSIYCFYVSYVLCSLLFFFNVAPCPKDDLESVLLTLAWCSSHHQSLPWTHLTAREDILALRIAMKNNPVFPDCDEQIAHLLITCMGDVERMKSHPDVADYNALSMRFSTSS